MSYHVTPLPRATFSSSQTQSVLNAAQSQAITYNTTIDNSGIILASNTRITLPQVGYYCISFSAIGHNSGSANAKWLNIWLKKNGSDVSNTSTIVGTAKDSPTTVVATFTIPCTTAGDYYELFMAGQDTGSQILATVASSGSGGIPAYPACPSIIVAVWQVS